MRSTLFQGLNKKRADVNNSPDTNHLIIRKDKSHFICPITQAIIFEPLMAYPCEHVFEKFALGTHMQASTTCPTCRAEILDVMPSRHFQNDLDSLLISYPALYDEQYFNLDYFNHAVRSRNASLLHKMLLLLSASAVHLNAPSEEKETLGISALYLIVTNDISILRTYPSMIANITTMGLNTVIHAGRLNGDSALYQLIRVREGRDILRDHVQLINLMTASTLHTKVSGDDDKTAAYWLLNTPDGKKLIIDHPELAEKVMGENKLALSLTHVNLHGESLQKKRAVRDGISTHKPNTGHRISERCRIS